MESRSSQRRILAAALLATALLALASACLPERFDDKAIDDKIAAAHYAKDCPAQVDCALDDCEEGEAACRAACRKGATAQTAERVDWVLNCRDACAAKYCAGVTGEPAAACKRQCVTYHCIEDSLQCAQVQPTGAGLCVDIFDCIEACNGKAGGTTACLRACGEQMNVDEFYVAQTMASCMHKASLANKPFQEICTAELASCYAGGQIGSKQCHEAFACNDACRVAGKSDAACARQCVGELSAAAQVQYVSFLQCLTAKAGAVQACRPTLITCAAPAGALSCKQMNEQLQGCLTKRGTTAMGGCLAQALHDGKAAAADPFLDLLLCYDKECKQACEKGGPGCTTCLTAKCGSAYAACNKP